MEEVAFLQSPSPDPEYGRLHRRWVTESGGGKRTPYLLKRHFSYSFFKYFFVQGTVVYCIQKCSLTPTAGQRSKDTLSLPFRGLKDAGVGGVLQCEH